MSTKANDPRTQDSTHRRLTCALRTVRPRKQRKPGPRVYTTDPSKVRGPHAHRRRRYGPLSKVTVRDEHHHGLPWPNLVFERASDDLWWNVPAVAVPLWYFDSWMLRKRIVVFHPPDLFTITGSDRRFKLVAEKQCNRVGYHRYLVCEVRDDDPSGNRGIP